MISEEMHKFVVTMAAHEKLITKLLDNYCETNHMRTLELHAVLSKIVYEIEREAPELTGRRETATEANKLHESLVESEEPNNDVFETAEELVDEVLEEY